MSKVPENTQAAEKKTDGKLLIKVAAAAGVFATLGELIGTFKIPVGPGNFILLPMIFAMIIAIILTPDALGKKIPALKKIIDVKEVNLAGELVMFELLYLGVPLGISAGKNILTVLEAGPALILQEFGNLGTMVLALPIALVLGMRREAVGATISICREPTMGLIGEHYGMDSPEGLGVMGTYMCGNLFGTIFYGLLGSISPMTGLHPNALAMACGMGSGSMMTAAYSSLAAAVPEMAESITAFAATSNVMTNLTGLYMDLFIALPLVNFLYKFWSKILVRKKEG